MGVVLGLLLGPVVSGDWVGSVVDGDTVGESVGCVKQYSSTSAYVSSPVHCGKLLSSGDPGL